MAVRFGYSPHALKMQALINRMVNPLATATSDLISVESLPQKDGDGVVPAEPRGKSDLGLGHRDTTPSRASQSEQTVVDQGQRAASEDKSKEERVQVKEENSPGKRRRSEDLSPEPADVRDDKRRKREGRREEHRVKEREHKSSSKRRRTADLSTEPARARGNKRRETEARRDSSSTHVEHSRQDREQHTTSASRKLTSNHSGKSKHREERREVPHRHERVSDRRYERSQYDAERPSSRKAYRSYNETDYYHDRRYSHRYHNDRRYSHR